MVISARFLWQDDDCEQRFPNPHRPRPDRVLADMLDRLDSSFRADQQAFHAKPQTGTTTQDIPLPSNSPQVTQEAHDQPIADDHSP